GVPATSCGGASAWLDHFANDLRGANVIILPDNDQPGFQLERQVKKSLNRVDATVTSVRLPGLSAGGDVHDWIEAGGTIEKLWALVEAERARTKPKTLIVPSATFVANFVPPDYLLEGVLLRRYLYSLTAPTGGGKTAVLLTLAAYVALKRNLGKREVAE